MMFFGHGTNIQGIGKRNVTVGSYLSLEKTTTRLETPISLREKRWMTESGVLFWSWPNACATALMKYITCYGAGRSGIVRREGIHVSD